MFWPGKHDTNSTLAAAKQLHGSSGRPNLCIKIPGTKEGLSAIEEAIFAGVPVNVTPHLPVLSRPVWISMRSPHGFRLTARRFRSP
ncbi:MAG: hypothetical protein KDI16_07635 [Halioglobus sp.]|nr:hypothetical protein [Halioglobus sp.]